jgi:integration host factor subunit alpha
MNVTKKDLVKSITKKSLIPSLESSKILEVFMLLIKSKAKLGTVKVSGFGTFSFKKTPKRIGRNPKTQDSYIIQERNKLNFKSSNKIKGKLN